MFANQKEHWNRIHAQGDIDRYSAKPTALAEEVVKLLPQHSKVLELGCGAGNDAAFFAQNGHQVTATDFSEVAIEKDRQRLPITLGFVILHTNKIEEFIIARSIL